MWQCNEPSRQPILIHQRTQEEFGIFAQKSIPSIKDKYLEKAQTSLHLELGEFRGNRIKTMGPLGGELLLAIVTRDLIIFFSCSIFLS